MTKLRRYVDVYLVSARCISSDALGQWIGHVSVFLFFRAWVTPRTLQVADQLTHFFHYHDTIKQFCCIVLIERTLRFWENWLFCSKTGWGGVVLNVWRKLKEHTSKQKICSDVTRIVRLFYFILSAGFDFSSSFICNKLSCMLWDFSASKVVVEAIYEKNAFLKLTHNFLDRSSWSWVLSHGPVRSHILLLYVGKQWLPEHCNVACNLYYHCVIIVYIIIVDILYLFILLRNYRMTCNYIER